MIIYFLNRLSITELIKICLNKKLRITISIILFLAFKKWLLLTITTTKNLCYMSYKRRYVVTVLINL